MVQTARVDWPGLRGRQTKGLIKIIIECQTSRVFNFTGQKIERTEHQKNHDNIAKNKLMTLIADTSGVKLQF